MTLVRQIIFSLFSMGLLSLMSWGAEQSDRVLIRSGSYQPLWKVKGVKKSIAVSSFYLDKTPVTHRDFLDFVRQVPQWQRSQVLPLFADSAYLQQWSSDEVLGSAVVATYPVTQVSWFAAKAYCLWKNKRLPTVDEWEYVAQASETQIDGTQEPGFRKRILEWYSKPTPDTLRKVGTGFKNVWGVADMHGLIWEWVLDFNSFLVTGESRGDSALERKLYCGAGALGSADPSDYAAFMRYGFRSSLKASYSVANLGFRCARDLEPISNLPRVSAQSTWLDQEGRKRQWTDFYGAVQVVAMAYTRCAYACPRIISDMKAIEKKLPKETLNSVRFVMVSLDTLRDRPEVLKAYGQKRHLNVKRWSLLHGSDPQVLDLAARLGVKYKRFENGDFAHSYLISVLDQAGVLRYQQEGENQNADTTVKEILELLAPSVRR